MSRYTVLLPDDEMLAALNKHQSPHAVAVALGISPSTVRTWMRDNNVRKMIFWFMPPHPQPNTNGNEKTNES